MFPSGEDLAGADRQRRRLHGYRLKPTLGGAAQRRDPLGEQIAEFFRGLCDFVEEFMEGDKVWPLDIPMGLLGLPLEIDGRRQVAIEQPDGLEADRLSQGVLGLGVSAVGPVHGRLLSFAWTKCGGGAVIGQMSNFFPIKWENRFKPERVPRRVGQARMPANRTRADARFRGAKRGRFLGSAVPRRRVGQRASSR